MAAIQSTGEKQRTPAFYFLSSLPFSSSLSLLILVILKHCKSMPAMIPSWLKKKA
jgi:hypothetical protein